MSVTVNDAAKGQRAVDHGALVDGPDPRRWLALCVIATAQLMVVLDASVVNIALPKAQKDLHISSLSSAQWVITAYTLAFGGLLLLGGRISDYNGRKKSFIIGLLGFAAASAVGGAAVNSTMLYGSRAVQGAFAALLAPAALSLISTTFTEPKERATAFGVYGGIAGGGAAIGLVLGGVLTEISWRLCLFINVPIAIVTALGAWKIVHESAVTGKSRYDIPGAILVGGGLVSLVYGCTEAAKPGIGWGSGEVLALLALAVVLLVGFVLQERRSPGPLLPLRVLLDRTRGGSYLASVLIGAGLFAMFLFLTYYFQSNLGYTPLRSGFAFLPFGFGIIIAAGIASQLLPRTGPKVLMMIGAAMGTTGLLSLISIGSHTSWLTHVLPGEVLLSLGMGLVFVPMSATALVGIGEQDAGVASAMLNTSQQIGGALGTAILSTLYVSSWQGYLSGHHIAALQTPVGPQPTPLAAIHGYHTAFIVGAALLAVALVVVTVLIRARKDDLPEDLALLA